MRARGLFDLSLGVYRFWRDAGFIAGAFLAGAFADLLGFSAAIQFVAALTVASGVLARITVRGGRLSGLMESGSSGCSRSGVNASDANAKNN